MSRTRRSALNLATSALMSAVQMIVGLVAARLLVRWLGNETLGIFTAANGWVGQLAILELGIAGAVSPVLARAAGHGNPAEIRAGLAAAFKPYIRIAFLSLLGAIVLLWAITRLMAIPADHVLDARLGIAVAALGLLFLPLNPLRSLIDASQRGYALNIILIMQSLGITALSLLFAWAHWGVTGQFLAAFIGLVLFYSSIVWDVRKRVPGFARLFFQNADPTVSAELRQLQRPTLICGVSGRIGLLTDNLVIAYFFGPAAVVPFFFAQRLCSITQTQLQNVGGATWAALTELHVLGHRELFATRLVQLTRLVCALGCAAIVPIIAYNQAFFALWQPRLVWPGQTLTVLASVNAVVWSILSLWTWIFSGTGRIARLVPLAIYSSIINVVISVAATKCGLLYGPVLGSTICLAGVQLWWMPQLIRKEFEIRPAQLFGAIARPLVVAVPCGALVLCAAHAWMPRHWIVLIVEMAGSGFGLLLLDYLLILNAQERNSWRKRASSLMPRTSNLPVPVATEGAPE